MYENRKFVIFETQETGSIDFNEVLETNNTTLRLNNNGSKTFVKYEGSQPNSVSTLSTKSQEYSHIEIMNILSGSEWSSDGEIITGE